MRILVVDDEPVARRRLIDILGTIDDVEVAGEAANTVETLARISELHPDVLLLDIHMPGEDGMSFALRQPDLPPIIFTTANDDQALAAFEASAVDYLVKPVRRRRLVDALSKVRRRTDNDDVAATLERLLSRTRQAPSARISARQGDTTYVFDAREIPRFYASDKYTCFHHEGREYLLEVSLSSLDERLREHGFLRVHRSELVSLAHVRAIRGEESGGGVVELSSGEQSRVSRRALPGLRRAIRAE